MLKYFCLLLILFSFFPFFTRGADFSNVVINEIAWMGTKVEGVESKNWWRYEWLELYNNTDGSISLDGWKVELYGSDIDFVFDLKGIISAKGYFLIVSADKIFSNYDFNYSNLGGKFNNNGQKVLLKNNLGDIIDNLDCFSSKKWFAGDNKTKQTMERKNSMMPGDIPDNWQNSQNPGGTPKTQNSVASANQISSIPENTQAEPTPTPKPAEVKPPPIAPSPSAALPVKEISYLSDIVINEILPSPKGPDSEEEFIEIFNQNNFEVDISGWKIGDTAGKIMVYVFPEKTKISPKGFLLLLRPETKITLNNDGDGLNLIQPNGNIIDKVTYEKALLGQSYNKAPSGWFWSITLTPGKTNIIPEKEKPQKTEEEEVKPPETELFSKKETAAVGEKLSTPFNFPSVLLIALSIAIFSAIIILILKKKISQRT